MPIRRYKPTSPGRRFMSVSTFEEITKKEPEKSLTAPLKKSGGRNVHGRITTRHQGGGHKRRYRIVDFKRVKDGVPAKVAAIEYDPNRSARIALLHYADGFKAYILAPAGLRVGSFVRKGDRLGKLFHPGATHLHLALVEIIGGAPGGRYKGVNIFRDIRDMAMARTARTLSVMFRQSGSPPAVTTI